MYFIEKKFNIFFYSLLLFLKIIVSYVNNILNTSDYLKIKTATTVLSVSKRTNIRL